MSSKSRNVRSASLLILTIQNTLFVLAMRYSRTRDGDMYYSSTVVFMIVVVKLISCFLLEFVKVKSLSKLIKSLVDAVLHNPQDTLKMAVPSFAFVLQNNLLYVAASHLEAVTYQISYQMKILTTAFFAVTMLNKKLLPTQWSALFILIGGVALVQLSEVSESHGSKKSSQEQNKVVGFIAIFGASIISGFAGVFFEKVLKSTDLSVWMRNIQLSLLSLPLSLVNCFVNDGENISKTGFFFGYDWFIIYLIFISSLGALIIAVVIKYAGNILKGFATSLAIVISCICSMYLFKLQLTLQFVFGACLVIFSIFLYGYIPSIWIRPKMENGKIVATVAVEDISVSKNVSQIV